MKKNNHFKKLQKLIWRDIAIFIVIYFIGGFCLKFFNIESNSILRFLILGAIPVLLVISVYTKLVRCPYECGNCKNIFNIKFRDMSAMRLGDTRKLKCPYCNITTWAKVKIN